MSIVKFSEVAHRAYTREDRFNTEKIYYVGGEHIDSCELYVTKKGVIKGSTIGPMFYCGFTAGQILFVTRNPHLKKCSIADFDGICSEKTFVIETKDESILTQEYLAIIMQSDDFWNYCEENKSGGVNYFLNWSTLADYEFELPPIKQQLEIAQKVMSAYRLKQSYKKLLDATREMVKSQFIEMFGTVESYCKLEDLVSDTFPGEWGSEPTSENAIKVIRTTNFTNEGHLDLADVVTRDIEPKKVARKKLKQGDTILERSGGTKDNPVGRVVFFDEIGDYLLNNFTQALRPKESVNPVYLFYALYNSYNINKAAMRAMASQTTGIQNLSMSDFMSKSIVLPSRDEQNKFEQIYRQADKSEFVGCKSQFIEMFSGAPKVGINNLVDTVWGSSPDSKTYNDIGEGMPFYQGKTEFGDLYINAPVTYCTAPIKMAKANAILMSVRAPVGAVNIATQDCCIGRGLASITPKEGKSTTMFVYYALKYMEADIDRLGTGSTFKAINKESYAKIQMPNAKISEQAKFVSIAEQADKSEYYN